MYTIYDADDISYSASSLVRPLFYISSQAHTRDTKIHVLPCLLSVCREIARGVEIGGGRGRKRGGDWRGVEEGWRLEGGRRGVELEGGRRGVEIGRGWRRRRRTEDGGGDWKGMERRGEYGGGGGGGGKGTG